MKLEDIEIPKSIHVTLKPEHREALKYLCKEKAYIFEGKEGLSGVIRELIKAKYIELYAEHPWPSWYQLMHLEKEGEEP